MNIIKRCSAAVIASGMLAASVQYAVSAASGINVQSRTSQEIAEYIENNPFEYSASGYVAEPDYKNAPYSPGKLDNETLENALNALNTMRFIAGLDEVSLNSEYSELVQAGTLVNAVLGQLSHTPSQPAGMPDELYQKGYKGTSSANLGMGYNSLAHSIISGWMSDAGASNISRVGHRRWCLNPSMQETGFGNTGKYYAMYAFDNTWGATDYYGVCWPAQVMPLEYFQDNDPWSISMGYSVDASAVKVELVRNSDGEAWEFSQSSADGYFNVENSNYGKKGCIIFRPDDISYSVGDSFDVSITGLDEDVSYTVEFVDVFAKQPEITIETLSSLADFLVGREYSAENVSDLNEDGSTDVFDMVYARKNMLKATPHN